MSRYPDISLQSIAGIIPQVSTLVDVLQLHGSIYQVERIPAQQTKRRLIPPKIILRFAGIKVMVVFIDTGVELPPGSLVYIVGVENGSPLRAIDGLHTGMSMDDVEAIIAAGYLVQRIFSCGSVEVVATEGQRTNILFIQIENGRVAFIGLNKKELELNCSTGQPQVTKMNREGCLLTACQSASKIDPPSAFNSDPLLISLPIISNC